MNNPCKENNLASEFYVMSMLHRKGASPSLSKRNKFVAVTDITGLPTTATAGTPLTLSGTVTPSNATNTTITLSVKNAGTTGATISGNTLNTSAAGEAIVTATIVDGTAQGTDYTKDFTVTVNQSGSVDPVDPTDPVDPPDPTCPTNPVDPVDPIDTALNGIWLDVNNKEWIFDNGTYSDINNSRTRKGTYITSDNNITITTTHVNYNDPLYEQGKWYTREELFVFYIEHNEDEDETNDTLDTIFIVISGTYSISDDTLIIIGEKTTTYTKKIE